MSNRTKFFDMFEKSLKDSVLYTAINDNAYNDIDAMKEAMKPSEQTIYFNNNIALTNGSSTSPKVIPNLYQTIEDLARTSSLPSTADKGLYVQSQELSTVGEIVDGIRTPVENARMITLRPESFTDTSKNATGERKHHTIFNIDANSIYFTIDNPYGRIQAIPLKSMKLDAVLDSYILSSDTEALAILKQNIDSTGIAATDTVNVYPFFVSNTRQYEASIVQLITDGEYVLIRDIEGIIIVCIYTNNSLVHCYTKAITVGSDVPVDAGKITLQPCDKGDTEPPIYYTPVSLSSIPYPVKQPYSLRAIIEAIQELNRRTAFMDGSIGIFGANEMHDVKPSHDNALHESTMDGLPGLVNGNITGSV